MNSQELHSPSQSPSRIVNYNDDSDSSGSQSPLHIVNYLFDDSDSDGPNSLSSSIDTESVIIPNNSSSNDGQTVDHAKLNASIPASSNPSLPNLNLPPLIEPPTDATNEREVLGVLEVLAKPRRKRKYAMATDELPETMIKLLAEMKTFFTKPMNLERMSPAISKTTFEKAHERICCYLGFVKFEKNIPSREINESIFKNGDLIQSYLNYLDETRNLNPSTISNHIGAILYVLKYFNKQLAPKYHGITLITQLRNLATELQREGEVLRPKTAKELKDMGKWLSWGEIIECLQLQRQKFEISRGKQQAKEMQDLLLIAVYSHMPPSRGLEIRTLCYFKESPQMTFNAREFTKKNVLVHQSCGDFAFHFQDYKTSKFHGHDEVVIERGTELNRMLTDFFQKFRNSLTSKDSGDYVFLNSCGNQFTGSAFTKHFQQLFYKLSGFEISINCLRSSFVTHAYSQEKCPDSLKTSLSYALRHSEKQAQLTYDKRTLSEKKHEAMNFARDFAENHHTSGPGEQLDTSNTIIRHKFKPSAFIAVVEDDSTLQQPKFIIGRVLHYREIGNEVVLLWYKHLKGANYTLAMDGSEWIEDVNTLHAVKMSASKTKSDQYVLMTSPTAIHNKVFSKK